MSNTIFPVNLLFGIIVIRKSWNVHQNDFENRILQSNCLNSDNCNNFNKFLNTLLISFEELDSNEEMNAIISLYVTSIKNEMAALEIFINANKFIGSKEAHNLGQQGIAALFSAKNMATTADKLFEEKRLKYINGFDYVSKTSVEEVLAFIHSSEQSKPGNK